MQRICQLRPSIISSLQRARGALTLILIDIARAKPQKCIIVGCGFAVFRTADKIVCIMLVVRDDAYLLLFPSWRARVDIRIAIKYIH